MPDEKLVCGLSASPHGSETYSTLLTILKFTAWIFARNGSLFSASGLQMDDALAMAAEDNAGTLANYTFEI